MTYFWFKQIVLELFLNFKSPHFLFAVIRTGFSMVMLISKGPFDASRRIIDGKSKKFDLWGVSIFRRLSVDYLSARDFPSDHGRKYNFQKISVGVFDLNTTDNRRKTPRGMLYLLSEKVKTNRRKIIFGSFFKNMFTSHRILNEFFLSPQFPKNVFDQARREFPRDIFSVETSGNSFPSIFRRFRRKILSVDYPLKTSNGL